MTKNTLSFYRFQRQIEVSIVSTSLHYDSYRLELCFGSYFVKVKAEKYGTAVPFVCLNKYSSDNARGIALSGSEAGWHWLRTDAGSRRGTLFSSLFETRRGVAISREGKGGTRRGMFNASLNISMSNIALTRGI